MCEKAGARESVHGGRKGVVRWILAMHYFDKKHIHTPTHSPAMSAASAAWLSWFSRDSSLDASSPATSSPPCWHSCKSDPRPYQAAPLFRSTSIAANKQSQLRNGGEKCKTVSCLAVLLSVPSVCCRPAAFSTVPRLSPARKSRSAAFDCRADCAENPARAMASALTSGACGSPSVPSTALRAFKSPIARVMTSRFITWFSSSPLTLSELYVYRWVYRCGVYIEMHIYIKFTYVCVHEHVDIC